MCYTVSMNDKHMSGLAAEFQAAAYYVKQGYEIYWPMHSQSRADFLIHKDGEYKKIQVKKATWSQTGPYKYLQSRVSTRNKGSKPLYEEGDFDFIVFVEDEGRMWIMPFEVIKGMTSVCLASTNTEPRVNTKTYDPSKYEVKL